MDVTSRRAGKPAFRWSSDGKGEYTIEPVESFEPFPAGAANASDGTGPATEVLVHFNDEGEEFLSRWKLEDILKRYSNHIAYPIHLVSMEKDYDAKGESLGEKPKD